MKMAQKMMDGFIRDTICWQMNCLRSTVVGVYACRQLKAGDAAQPERLLCLLCAGADRTKKHLDNSEIALLHVQKSDSSIEIYFKIYRFENKYPDCRTIRTPISE